MFSFNGRALVNSPWSGGRIVEYLRGEVVFRQGDACHDVMYIQKGGVKLSVHSKTGREAVVATLRPGEFFGEACLAGQRVRSGSATAVTPSTILLVAKRDMMRLLQQQHATCDRFITHMLTRNIHMEQDLVDQLFNSSEKRLARTLLLLARYGQSGRARRVVPRVSLETLADTAGTTRARVSFFLKKFKQRGFIEDDGEFTVNRSLLTVLLRD